MTATSTSQSEAEQGWLKSASGGRTTVEGGPAPPGERPDEKHANRSHDNIEQHFRKKTNMYQVEWHTGENRKCFY